MDVLKSVPMGRRSGRKKRAGKPTAEQGRRDFAKWSFIVALLAWLFPDPLSRLFLPAPMQKVASNDSLRIQVQDSIPVRESIILTPKPATMTLSTNNPTVVVATATQTNANVSGF